MWFHIWLAITSIWKVQFQEFKHFSVACNELFHMVRLTQKYFSTQIWSFFLIVPWINIHENGLFWVGNYFCVELTIWKSSLLATGKCSNCWNLTFQTEVMTVQTWKVAYKSCVSRFGFPTSYRSRPLNPPWLYSRPTNQWFILLVHESNHHPKTWWGEDTITVV